MPKMWKPFKGQVTLAGHISDFMSRQKAGNPIVGSPYTGGLAVTELTQAEVWLEASVECRSDVVLEKPVVRFFIGWG